MSMSLDGLQNVVLLFSDPIWSGQNTIPSTIIRNLTALSGNLAYSDNISENLTVLTSKYTETQNGILQGLLYVPDLPSSDACIDYEREFVPDTAVRQSNLPPTNYNLIALAPWFSTNCTQAYLASARVDPLRAFIFYQPSNDTSRPPNADSSEWDLGDNGVWKTQNHYPIFAVSGALGAEMMFQLSRYSGNLTEVPYGQNISEAYNPDPDDYVRIWTQLSVSTPSGLPKIWVFVLVILGVLLAIVTCVTFLMRFIWKRRRKSLQRRVMSGEVNLETMGIKRLSVPLVHIEKFPLFTYNYDPPPPPPESAPGSPTSAYTAPLSQSLPPDSSVAGGAHDGASAVGAMSNPSSSEKDSRSPAVTAASVLASPTINTNRAASSAMADLDYQPTCQICLEDFESRVTIIRELPCGHIFHPECIDEFLSEISSLCPLCKASMLPKDYCPRITNSMVRRERAMRRLRERIIVDDSDMESNRGSRIQSWGSSVKKHFHHVSQRSVPPPHSAQASEVLRDSDNIELEPQPSHQPSSQRAPSEVVSQAASRAASQASRPDRHRLGAATEATRRRMHQLAGSDADPASTRASKWKRLRHRVLPS